MNPARTLGPDIVGVNFTGWWVYAFGDLLGAAIAVAIITLVRSLARGAPLTAGDCSPR
jgi:aquaporin Z